MVEAAALPPAAESETFRGYTQEDIARAVRFKDPAPTSTPDFFTDYFGIKTHISRASWLAGSSGMVQDQPPFPNDHFLAEGIEYAAALLALETATGPSFAAVELGAGWGPWTALMGALARRRALSNINLLAVEASPKRFALLQSHLADNGLLPGGEVGASPIHTRLVNAAGWWRNTSLYFPESDAADDAGMAATPVRRAIDYRGAAVVQVRIPAISIPALCRPYPVIDFMHVDIQGGEWELIRHARTFLDTKVRFLFVGTHSRKIEGDLIAFLMRRGWKLEREKPCRFDGQGHTPVLTGLTTEDGGQVWRNPRLA